MKILKLGSSGQDVKELQILLNSHGFNLAVDGSFGPATQKAVKEFQLSRKIVSDGIVGPATMAELEKAHNIEVLHTPSQFEFGRAYSPDDFKTYVNGTVWINWKPSLIVIHHTAVPSLVQRPNGFTYQHMLNLKDYYKGLGWGDKGPHLFGDDDEIFTYQPLTKTGIHAKSFNSNGIGIELLGNYDSEDPWSGRGLSVLTTGAKAVKALMTKLGLTKSSIRYHRDDPLTSKTCPGTKIGKQQFLDFLDTV